MTQPLSRIAHDSACGRPHTARCSTHRSRVCVEWLTQRTRAHAPREVQHDLDTRPHRPGGASLWRSLDWLARRVADGHVPCRSRDSDAGAQGEGPPAHSSGGARRTGARPARAQPRRASGDDGGAADGGRRDGRRDVRDVGSCCLAAPPGRPIWPRPGGPSRPGTRGAACPWNSRSPARNSGRVARHAPGGSSVVPRDARAMLRARRRAWRRQAHRHPGTTSTPTPRFLVDARMDAAHQFCATAVTVPVATRLSGAGPSWRTHHGHTGPDSICPRSRCGGPTADARCARDAAAFAASGARTRPALAPARGGPPAARAPPPAAPPPPPPPPRAAMHGGAGSATSAPARIS